jgi:hypothetical protein
MLYSILIYGSEDRVAAWTPEEEDAALGRHAQLRATYRAQAGLGPVMRLMPNTATTVRFTADGEPLLTDGPFAETKEQLMGLYTIECATLQDAVAATRQLCFDTCTFEVRPLTWFDPGVLPAHMPQGEK